MRISNIAPKVSSALSEGMTNLGRNVQKNGSLSSKINKFTEGRGVNCARGAFLTMVYSCTLIPRFLKARDNDERSEILRRDIVTLFTICFAMKAIKAGACSLMAKKSGLPLTFTNIPEGANKFKKALGYFQQKGTTAFSAEDITANYANIDSKETITRFLDYVDKNHGDVGKVLTFDKAKPNSLFKGKHEDGALTKAAKKLLGKDFDFTKPGSEIISEIKKKNASDEAFTNLSNALKDSDTNPVSKFAKGISAKFETFALIAVAGFLGFGLPKLNEKMTKDKYFSGDGALKTSYENPNSGVPNRPMPSALNTLNTGQRMVFQNFLGSYKSSASNQNQNMQNIQNELNKQA